jgi:hypothetical protein
MNGKRAILLTVIVISIFVLTNFHLNISLNYNSNENFTVIEHLRSSDTFKFWIKVNFIKLIYFLSIYFYIFKANFIIYFFIPSSVLIILIIYLFYKFKSINSVCTLCLTSNLSMKYKMLITPSVTFFVLFFISSAPICIISMQKSFF